MAAEVEKSFTAEDAEDGKEKKGFTAKAAEDGPINKKTKAKGRAETTPRCHGWWPHCPATQQKLD